MMSTKRHVLGTFTAALLTTALAACGGGGSAGGASNSSSGGASNSTAGGSSGQQETNPDTVVCAESIDVLVQGLADKTPTWEELACFTEDLPRFEAPAFVKRILLGSDTLPENATAWQVHLEQIEQTWQEWPINVANSLPGPMPPHLVNGELRTYPMTPEGLDLEMRSYATVLLYEKLVHGRPLFFSHFWPPEAVKEFDTYQDYLAFMEDVYLPELEAVADAAEFVKAEYFLPFLLEAEVYVNGLGEWIDDLGEVEKLAIAQDFVDRVHETVRPRYNGILIAHSYATYSAFGDYWSNISYSRYDFMNFALFPQCNIEVTEQYLDNQFGHYMTIVSRDSIPYFINELTVMEKYFFCEDFDLEAQEAALYEAVLAKIDSQPIAPVGLSAGAPRSAEARQVLKDYFNAH